MKIASALALFAIAFGSHAAEAQRETPPNIVIIFADDLGYGDLGSYGHPSIRTPNLDQLASEGLRFTDFYVAAPLCTPSRAALLTGRYPVRSGMVGRRGVLFPESTGGLPDSEITIAEMLKKHDYATLHIGKWHLGVRPGGRPLDQGFDHSFGLPYSNDMDGTVPNSNALSGLPETPIETWNVPLIRDGKIIERPTDQTTLTKRYTQEVVTFIDQNVDRPFFIYFAHTFPHVPLYASPEFKGRSPRGIYGDAVEEIDWSVGEVLAALRRAGVAENTLVVFTSDNGPWLTKGLQGGSAGLLRDGKQSTWEGGQRVPGIMSWEGRIRPGVMNMLTSTMDLWPTIAALVGESLPTDRILDGQDLAPLLFEGQTLSDRPFFYYRDREIYAARIGAYKLHLSTHNGYSPIPPVRHDPPLLFDLGRDPNESTDVAAEHPEIVRAILAAIAAHEATVEQVPNQLDN